MSIFQKAALCLLIAVGLFAVIAALAFTGLFNLIETRFYNPSITRSLIGETARDTEILQNLLADLQNRFADSLDEPQVRRSFLPNQRDADILERSRIYRDLLETTGGLQSVRFVDSGGKRIHFSTYAPDMIIQEGISMGYRDYTDDLRNLAFDKVHVSEHGNSYLTMDKAQERIIFSFPFSDSMDVYRGTALFTLSAGAVAERLISTGRIRVGENVTLINAPPGIISGGPENSINEIIAGVSAIWDSGLLSLASLDTVVSDTGLTLISAKTSQGVFYGRVIDEAVLPFPLPMKILLLLSAFFTIYLAIFFLFNLKQDAMTTIRSRLKGLQIALIEQFYENKGGMDWARWTMELEQRRAGIRSAVKQGIKAGKTGYSEGDIDSLIDKSWDELLALISAWGKTGTGIDEEKLERILSRVLHSQAAPQPSPEPTPASAAVMPADEPPPEEADLSLELEAELLDEEETSDYLQEEAAYVIKPATRETLSLFTDIARAGNISLLEAEEINESVNAETEKASPQRQPSNAGGLLAAAIKIRINEPPVSSGEKNTMAHNEGKPETPDRGDNTVTAKEAEEVEEFEDAEEVEELEGLDEDEDEEPGELEEIEEEHHVTKNQFSENSGPAGQSIKELESIIEFGSGPASDAGDSAADLPEELEIVSPFASMLSSLESGESAEAAENGETAVPGEDEKKNHDVSSAILSDAPAGENRSLEEFAAEMFLMSRPFMAEAVHAPEFLHTVNGAGLVSADAGGVSESVITEQDGLYYLNRRAFIPDSQTKKKLNSDFRVLVDSVIGI